MVQKILIVHARELDFSAGEDKVKGTQVHYLMTDIEPAKGEQGFSPAKAFLKGQATKGIMVVPGVYEAQFSASMKNQKVSLRLDEVAFVAAVDLAI